MMLDWPKEYAMHTTGNPNRWFHPSTNYCLDFHGDPASSELLVFSDGNHHMALEQTLEYFRASKQLNSIFYTTTPPKVYLDWLKAGSIDIGNMRLSGKPNIVIGPDDVIEQLVQQNVVTLNKTFAKSMGISLLVEKGNPKGIVDVEDIFADGVQVFLSNPITEKASHSVYRQALQARANELELGIKDVVDMLTSTGSTFFGDLIHHREAPQAIIDSAADVAVVYNHLALRYARVFPDLLEQVLLPGAGQQVVTQYSIGIANPGNKLAYELYDYFHSEEAMDSYTWHGLEPIPQQ